MNKKIEIGSEITRSYKQIWRITRIEMSETLDLFIFACPDSWYQKHFDNKLKLYDRDELIYKFMHVN